MTCHFIKVPYTYKTKNNTTMTQNEKDLLLQDICSRLPYGVICKSVNFKNPIKLVSIDLDGPSHDVYFCTNDDGAMWNDYDEIKPYLFPLSSMTEEQKYDFYCRFVENQIGFDDFKEFYLDGGAWNKLLTSMDDIGSITDWFIKNHFDYRGLIPMGLAIDATGLNVY